MSAPYDQYLWTIKDALEALESKAYYEAKPHKAQADLETVRRILEEGLDSE